MMQKIGGLFMAFFNSTIRLLSDWQGRGFIDATSIFDGVLGS